LLARLQHEYQRQNEANVEQLQRLENLNQQLISFVETLTRVTSQQETSYAVLSGALPGVQEKLTTLNDNLRNVIVEGFPSVAANDAIDTGGLEKQIKENTTRLVTELDKLVRIGDEIRKLQSRNGRKEQSQTISPVAVITQPPQPFSQVNTIFNEENPDAPSRAGIRGRIRAAWRKLKRRKR
jgi:hypothetical protein